jgi:hypothetical protein
LTNNGIKERKPEIERNRKRKRLITEIEMKKKYLRKQRKEMKNETLTKTEMEDET